MAPVEPASDASSVRNLTLPEVIFSCGICQASVSEVYATPESNKGFHSGSGDDDGIVTRLWIAECSHIFCGKHLAGGAAPFHPQGEQPQAICLQCLQAGDETPKKLYAIRGLDDSEHDQAIPQTWFQCPPIRLDGAAPGMDAVRFQYMALARYSQKVHTRWKVAEEKHAAAVQGTRDERKQRKQLQHDLNEAKARAISEAEALEKSQTSLKRWEARMPVIHSLMTAVTPMAKDLQAMRLKLTELGFEVPARSYGFEDLPYDVGSATKEKNSQVAQLLQARKVQGSSSSLRKRKRDEHDMELDDPDHDTTHRTQRMSSREMMPPPPPQRLQRWDMHPNTAALSETSMEQHREVYERSPEMSASRYRTQDSFSMPTQRPFSAREEDWSSLSTRNDKVAVKRPYDDHGYDNNQVITNEGPESFYGATQLIQTASARPAHGFAQPPSQHFFKSQPAPLQRQYTISRMSDADDAFSGGSLQDRRMPTRQPLRPIASNPNLLQTPPRRSHQYTGPNATTSPFKTGQPASSSINSPFFQRGMGISHANSTRLLPPRAGDVSYARERQNHTLTFPPMQRGLVTRADESSYDNRPRLTSTKQRSHGYSLFGQPSSTAAFQYSGAPVMRQTSTASRHASDAPRDGLSQNTFISQQSLAQSRGRITLPPSAYSQQDHELTAIRGLRGGASRRAEGYQTPSNPGYNGSRELFTAGNRRSVRR